MANLTVSEAAAELGTTQPRLRRLLARPDFAGRVHQQERETKTGTRTATVVPVLLLDDLRAVLEAAPIREQKREREPSPPEQEHEQEQAASLPFSFPMSAQEPDQLSPLGARLVAEMEGRIADLQRQLELANAALEREQMNHARTQALAALPAPVESEAEKKSGLGGVSVVNESPLRARLKVRLNGA